MKPHKGTSETPDTRRLFESASMLAFFSSFSALQRAGFKQGTNEMPGPPSKVKAITCQSGAGYFLLFINAWLGARPLAPGLGLSSLLAHRRGNKGARAAPEAGRHTGAPEAGRCTGAPSLNPHEFYCLTEGPCFWRRPLRKNMGL